MIHEEMSTLLSGNDLSPEEYGEFYGRYIRKSIGENLFTRLKAGYRDVTEVLQSLDDEVALFKYAEGKWTIKETVGHMIDTERIMNFRALTFARGDTHPLPGFDQDDYVTAANFNQTPLDDLMQQYRGVRSATLQLFSSFDDEMLMSTGMASDSKFTVRALGFIIAGHEIHHLDIFNEKYLPKI
ncbi:DinB family protein [Rhodohalobacter sp. 8-1]|uniref:DinB family protein n=1 Tax=Rhodohalobacter sp. 8-1 TaxID=3131972 RepID=UPI0030EC3695